MFFFFPYAIGENLERQPIITYILLAINWVVFVLMFLTPMGLENRDAIMSMFAYVPADVKPWAFITHAFMHGDIFHILGNSMFLYLFGSYVENKLGRLWYPLFYLAGGTVAALGQHALSGSENIPMVGASGAIAALMGAFMCLRPWADVRHIFIYWILLYIGTYRINIPMFVYLFVFFLWGNMSSALTGMDDGVGYGAHLGGFFFGYFLLLGFYGFSGWNEEKEPQIWFKQRARAKKLKAASSGEADPEIAMNTRLDAASILNEVVGIGDPELIVRAYHQAMAKYPDLMLEPGVQERMAGLMERGGFTRDALHAMEKLIQNVPRSSAGQRAHLAAGKICAGVPDFYEKGRLFLREYLDNFVSAEKRLEAQALLLTIETSMRAQGVEPTPMRPVSPAPGSRPAVDPADIPENLRPPNWKKNQPPTEHGAGNAAAGTGRAPQSPAGPMRTVVGVAANEAPPPDPFEGMTIQTSLDAAEAQFPDMGMTPGGADREALPPPIAHDAPAHDGVIPTTYQRAAPRSRDRVKRTMSPSDSQAPFAPPPEMKPATHKSRPRLNTLDGAASPLRSKPAGLIVALPRRAPTDWETLEVFLAHVWGCNKTEAKARLHDSRGILLRDASEADVAAAERFAQQAGIPLLIVRGDSYPNVRQPVDVSSITLNEAGALILSANKKHHVKWEEAALLGAAGLRQGQADGSPLRVFDLVCREPMRSYRGFEHIGWFSVAPSSNRFRFSDRFDELLRQMAAFAPRMELGAGMEMGNSGGESKADAGAAMNFRAGKAAPVKLPAFNTLKDYNLYLEWHAIQMGSRLN